VGVGFFLVVCVFCATHCSFGFCDWVDTIFTYAQRFRMPMFVVRDGAVRKCISIVFLCLRNNTDRVDRGAQAGNAFL